MGSSGSVIPLFIEKMQHRQEISITDTRMTRFFLTLEQAIQLLFHASQYSIGGEIFVMNMPACQITDLAEVLMSNYGSVNVKITGIRPGEKLDEILVSKNESMLTYAYDSDYYVILPAKANLHLKARYCEYAKFELEEFSSRTKLMDNSEIQQLLLKGGFL